MVGATGSGRGRHKGARGHAVESGDGADDSASQLRMVRPQDLREGISLTESDRPPRAG